MEFEMTLANPRGEIDGANQESEDSGKRMRDEQLPVCDYLKPIGVVHRVVSDEENF
jgi:hypothetical protein